MKKAKRKKGFKKLSIHHYSFLALLLGAAIVTTIFIVPSKINKAASNPSVYYGAYVPDAPRFSQNTNLADFERNAGKPVSIVHWFQGWGVTDGTQYFQTQWMNDVRNHGSIPLITWEPWNWRRGVNQNSYQLQDIINGNYDAYITKWAQDSKTWGNPYFLRFAHEMNASNYPWNEQKNGNKPGDYAKAWKHVHDIFTAQGVNNVTWVWCPNVEYAGTTPLEGLYPGDNYVDWVCMDGYNGGTALNWGGWQSFSQIFSTTYNHLQQLASSKPVMIGEFASAEAGGSKADWIADAYSTQVPTNFPNIKALVWFNANTDTDWRIESSTTSKTAFTTAVASDYYAGNVYASLTQSPIPALIGTPITPTPTATATPEASIAPTSTPSPIPLPTTGADQSPQTSIISPLNGSRITTRSVDVQASATDDKGIALVEIFINGVRRSSLTWPPYVYKWNTQSESAGTYSIYSRATDTIGQTAISATITVYK